MTNPILVGFVLLFYGGCFTRGMSIRLRGYCQYPIRYTLHPAHFSDGSTAHLTPIHLIIRPLCDLELGDDNTIPGTDGRVKGIFFANDFNGLRAVPATAHELTVRNGERTRS